ncbi:probable histone-lysine N-methyltransferase set-23 [Drosophila eugracilis]|uniref:probable histone-lysine N-methyltransferase set-23 n=1 Tax=Drosophila eugracilis TaxID=29029 RepID=UPI0007E68AA2|nr:probable histone-lysine N-methyltransferase set-23 [Drosophila eugracilis]
MNRSEVSLQDDYEHPDPLEYILESVLMPSDESLEYKLLADDYNSVLLNQCHCSGVCEDSKICPHGGQYDCSDGNDVLLRKTSLPVLECNDLCTCSRNTCCNRLAQYGPRKNLEIFDSPVFGSKGLRTTVGISKGGYICEYAGELLTPSEAKKRLLYNEENGLMNYILVLNEYASEKKQQVTIVDPSRRGNIGRYLNHSCEPNCYIAAVRIDCPIPKIGIFAARDILAQEELCFHYGGEGQLDNLVDGKPCLCASSKCTGFMPSTEIE